MYVSQQLINRTCAKAGVVSHTSLSLPLNCLAASFIPIFMMALIVIMFAVYRIEGRETGRMLNPMRHQILFGVQNGADDQVLTAFELQGEALASRKKNPEI